MLILKATKSDVIRQLEGYSAVLNSGHVKKSLFEKISGIYRTLREKTTEEARYIEIDEKEIDNVFAEYLCPLITKNNLIISVYLGHRVSVYAKQKIENALKDAVAVYTLPTTLSTDKIIIYLSYLDGVNSEMYDIDFATNLLNYYDD